MTSNVPKQQKSLEASYDEELEMIYDPDRDTYYIGKSLNQILLESIDDLNNRLNQMRQLVTEDLYDLYENYYHHPVTVRENNYHKLSFILSEIATFESATALYEEEYKLINNNLSQSQYLDSRLKDKLESEKSKAINELKNIQDKAYSIFDEYHKHLQGQLATSADASRKANIQLKLDRLSKIEIYPKKPNIENDDMVVFNLKSAKSNYSPTLFNAQNILSNDTHKNENNETYIRIPVGK